MPIPLYRLPLLLKRRVVREFSSHNRQGINIDNGSYLYKDKNDDAVIFDAERPGCLCSIWAAKLQGLTYPKFYFDSDETPKYGIHIRDFLGSTS